MQEDNEETPSSEPPTSTFDLAEPLNALPHIRDQHTPTFAQLAQKQPVPTEQPWPFNEPLQTESPGELDEEYSEGEDDGYGTDEEDETAFNKLYRNQSLAPPEISHERLEWQQMLESVLMGEVLKSEKKRLSTSDRMKQQKPIQEIWMSLRALLRGRTIAEEQRYLQDGRKDVQDVIDAVMAFRVTDDEGSPDALAQVAEVLKKVDRIESLYSTRADMINDKPAYGAAEFQARLDALNSWCTITRSLHMQYKILVDWTGSEELQIARKGRLETEEHPVTPAVENNFSSSMSHYMQVQRADPSFVERILKESALQDTFDKRTLSALNSLLVKSKRTMIANNSLFQEMNLPPFINQLRRLAVFPTSLVEEALKLRLEYKDRLNEPPKQMVDAMMEDYRGLLALACRVKRQYEELAYPAPGWQLRSDEFIDKDYDAVLMDSMRFYYKLIQWKLDLERENSLRECEVLEKEWDILRTTVCQVVQGADEECAVQFWQVSFFTVKKFRRGALMLTYKSSQMTNRLLTDVMHDYISNLKIPSESADSGVEDKYTKLLHTMRMRARKLLQFAKYVLLTYSPEA